MRKSCFTHYINEPSVVEVNNHQLQNKKWIDFVQKYSGQ